MAPRRRAKTRTTPATGAAPVAVLSTAARPASAPCKRTDWPAHKPARLVSEQRTREAAQAAAPSRAPPAAEGGECAIYLDPLSPTTATVLPCGHVSYLSCVKDLWSFGVKQFSPICRTALPPGPGKLNEDTVTLVFMIERRAVQGERPWAKLTRR
jgi:hypothetical protein